ncbi:MAG: hypothetical protein HKN85_03445 [Gammaproteobacteria bacterium]|nr:hypothetical protein [Gammaproteobacteria bacterium]
MKAADSEIDQYSSLDSNISDVLILQCIATSIVLLAVLAHSLVLVGEDIQLLAKLKAAAFGSSLALISTILSARSMRRTQHTASDEDSSLGRFSMAPVFSGLLNKLVIVGGGIGFGLIVGLNPILVVLTYLLVQISAAAQLLKAD